MPTPIVNKASAVWNGDLFTGSGRTSLDTSKAGSFDVNWKARAEESGAVTTPEELIAAAHATCFAMQFSNELKSNDTPPTQLDTNAEVTFVAGSGITGIHLTVAGQVPGITAEGFARIAESAKANCPVSQALAAVEITLTASLA
ncbi:MAG: OsmC family peroxiredoxin [Georgenia sp.]